MLMGTRPRATRPSPPDATLFPHHRDVRGCADSRVARIRGDVLIADHPVYPSRAGSPPRRRSRRIAARSDISDTQNTLHLDLPPAFAERRRRRIARLRLRRRVAPPERQFTTTPDAIATGEFRPSARIATLSSRRRRRGGFSGRNRAKRTRSSRGVASRRLRGRRRRRADARAGREPRRRTVPTTRRDGHRGSRGFPARPREESGVGVGVRVRGSREASYENRPFAAAEPAAGIALAIAPLVAVRLLFAAGTRSVARVAFAPGHSGGDGGASSIFRGVVAFFARATSANPRRSIFSRRLRERGATVVDDASSREMTHAITSDATLALPESAGADAGAGFPATVCPDWASECLKRGEVAPTEAFPPSAASAARRRRTEYRRVGGGARGAREGAREGALGGGTEPTRRGRGVCDASGDAAARFSVGSPPAPRTPPRAGRRTTRLRVCTVPAGGWRFPTRRRRLVRTSVG